MMIAPLRGVKPVVSVAGPSGVGGVAGEQGRRPGDVPLWLRVQQGRRKQRQDSAKTVLR